MITKENVFKQARQLGISFLKGTSKTRNMSGIHVQTNFDANNYANALNEAFNKNHTKIYVYTNFESLESSEYCLIKRHLDNLSIQYGSDIVKAVIMSELGLNDGF